MQCIFEQRVQKKDPNTVYSHGKGDSPNYLSNTFLIGDFDVDLQKFSPERELICHFAGSLGLKVLPTEVPRS